MLLDIILKYVFGLASSLWVLCLFSRGECRESQVAFIMKLYIVSDMIGQLYGHATLAMWKLNKKKAFSILKERKQGGKTILALLT